MDIRKHIPNLITLLNLLSGCIAIVFAANQDFEAAFYFVCLGIFFDFFDGFFARMFNVSSPLGLQLDSLADMVTSGVTPGLVMYYMMLDSQRPFTGYEFLGFLITLGSCYRLANFNVDTRQTDSFIGLPTPANALMIMSLPLILAYSDSLITLEVMINPYFLLSVTLFSTYILNAEVPLFSLKVKNFSFAKNALQISFLAVSLILLLFLQFAAIPLVILFYIVLSVFSNRMKRSADAA